MSFSTLERAVFEHPALWAWWSADPAYFDANTGTFFDKGPGDPVTGPRNWQQLVANNMPAQLSSWYGFSGVYARDFDNTKTTIPLIGRSPTGPQSAIALLDLNPGNGSGDGVTHSVMGSITGASSTYMTKMRVVNRTFKFFVSNNGTVGTALAPVSTPMVVAWSYDPIARTLAVSMNGSAWVTYTSVTWATMCANTTFQLGAVNGNGLTTAEYFFGAISEVLLFKCPLSSSRFTQIYSDARQMLASKVALIIP